MLSSSPRSQEPPRVHPACDHRGAGEPFRDALVPKVGARRHDEGPITEFPPSRRVEFKRIPLLQAQQFARQVCMIGHRPASSRHGSRIGADYAQRRSQPSVSAPTDNRRARPPGRRSAVRYNAPSTTSRMAGTWRTASASTTTAYGATSPRRTRSSTPSPCCPSTPVSSNAS